jgi:hypothetical protein
MFFVHIMGYAISDTALASLISRYSSPDAQVRTGLGTSPDVWTLLTRTDVPLCLSVPLCPLEIGLCRRLDG